MRKVSVFALAFFALAASSAWAQCLSTEGNFTDVTHFHNDTSGEDLSDYGVIFADANNPQCAFAAAGALYKKVYSTLNPSTTEGLPNYPYFDAQINANTWAYQGWQQGALVSLIYATAL